MVSKSSRRLRVFLAKLGIKRKYNTGKVYIDLDYTHSLPDYQASSPSYDRFLPHFVDYLLPNSLVVDVGANVGDTLAGMIGSNSQLQYLCIEADLNFHTELLKNIELIKTQVPEAMISAANVFVGKDVNDVSLEGKGGTKHAVPGGGAIRSQPLGEIFKSIDLNEPIALLKTDVDGFDYDVIRSSYDLLADCPFIYFECQCDNDDQLSSYKLLFDELLQMGYHHFALFDNFGQYAVTVDDAQQFSDLLDYIYRQNAKHGTRTLFYYDVLVYTREQSSVVKTALSEYT